MLQIKKIKRFANVGFLSLFVLLLASCGNIEEIEIGEPQSVKIIGFEDNYLKVATRIPVKNPSNYSFKITELDLKVYLNGRYMGKLLIDEQLTVKRKEDKIYELPVKVRMVNLMGTAMLMMNMKKGQKAELRIEGEVKARSMLITRTFPIDEKTSFTF